MHRRDFISFTAATALAWTGLLAPGCGAAAEEKVTFEIDGLT